MKKAAIFILVITIVFSLAFYFLNQKETQTMNQVDNSSTTNNNSAMQQLSMEEVATHNTQESCYLVIQNKVYDVSSFISKHPGGQQKIISNCGKEVSDLFASIHSNVAWDLLKNYQIGEVK